MQLTQRLYTWGLLAVALLVFPSCDPKGPNRQMQVEAEVPMTKTFDIQLNVADYFTIPESGMRTLRAEIERVLYQDHVSWSVQESLGATKVSVDDIKSLRLDKISIKCLNPTGLDLSILAPIRLYIGKDSRLFAETRVEPSQTDVIDLVLYEQNLLPYVSVSELPIMVTSKRASIPDWPNPDVKTIRVQVTFTGTASVLTK